MGLDQKLVAMRTWVQGHFLDPGALVHGWVLVAILLLYLLKLRRQSVTIPSTLLWHRLVTDPKVNSLFSRLRRSLLLLVQLAAAGVLVLGLMRPYTMGQEKLGDHVVLILDVSASMQATDVKPSRIREAGRQALELVGSLPAEAQVMLLLSGSRVRVSVPFTRDRGRLGSALGSLEARDVPGDLAQALVLCQSLVKAAGGGDRPGAVHVHVFTDGAMPDLELLKSPPPGLVLHRVGERGRNAGITQLDVRRSTMNPGEFQVFTQVASFAPEALTGTLDLKVDGRLVDSREVTLPPRGEVSLVFANPHPGSARLELALEIPDDLAVDNRAYAVLNPRDARRVALAGSHGSFERVASLLPGVKVERVDGERLQSLPAGALLVYRGSPASSSEVMRPGVRRLMVVDPERSFTPWPGGPAVTVTGTTTLAATVETPASHPVNRFVGYKGLTLPEHRRVDVSRALHPILEADGDPIILAGVFEGRRLMVLAFDPDVTELPVRASYPILVANIVEWFFAGQAGDQTRRTGEPVLLGDDMPEGPYRLELPGGIVSVPGIDALARELSQVETSGFLTVRTRSETRTYAQSLLSVRESDVTPRSTLRISGTPVEVRTHQAPVNQERWRVLILAALLLVLAEGWLYHRRVHQ